MHKLWLHNPAGLTLLEKDKLKGFISLKLACCLLESMSDILCYTHFASYFRTTCISPISLLPAAPESMGLICQNILRLTHTTIIIISYLWFTFLFLVSILPDSFAPLILVIIIYFFQKTKTTTDSHTIRDRLLSAIYILLSELCPLFFFLSLIFPQFQDLTITKTQVDDSLTRSVDWYRTKQFLNRQAQHCFWKLHHWKCNQT